MLWFAMPAMAQHDSITFRTRVADTTTAVCKSQPASRHLYGITKIVPEFVDEAAVQIQRYAQDPKLRLLCGPTRLHLIVAQFRGEQLVRTEEITLH